MSEELTQAQPLAPTVSRGGRRIPWRSLWLVAGSLAITVGMLLVPRDAVVRLGAYGYAGVFALVLLSSATIVLPSPAVGVALLAAKTLDPWLVGLISGVAAAIGELTGYLAGRGGGDIALRSHHYPRVERWVSRWGLLTIFVLALIPTPVMDLGGLAAGALRMPVHRFLLACLAGKTVRFIAVAWAGSLLAAMGLV